MYALKVGVLSVTPGSGKTVGWGAGDLGGSGGRNAVGDCVSEEKGNSTKVTEGWPQGWGVFSNRGTVGGGGGGTRDKNARPEKSLFHQGKLVDSPVNVYRPAGSGVDGGG